VQCNDVLVRKQWKVMQNYLVILGLDRRPKIEIAYLYAISEFYLI